MAERELSGLLSKENRSERHSAETCTNVDKNPGTITEANPQLVSFQGVFGNLSIRAVFPISSASSHAFAPTLKETTTCLPTSTCTPPFPVVSARVSTLPSFSSHDHLSMSASASLFQAVHSHASTLPVSSSRVIDHSPTFTPFTGPVYTHITQALDLVASANYTTMLYNTCAGAETHSPLVKDPRHVSPSLQPMNECFLATITATLEKMSANQGLPPLQVLKFNGSPERYPLYSDRGFTRWRNRKL